MLWTLDGVFITPHNAGDTPEAERAAQALARAQMLRHRAGRRCITWSAGPHALRDEVDERVELRLRHPLREALGHDARSPPPPTSALGATIDSRM